MLRQARREIARFVREHPALWNTLNPIYRDLVVVPAMERRLRSDYGDRLLARAQDGAALIREQLLSGRPTGIGKIGSLEAETLMVWCEAQDRGAPADWPRQLREQIVTNMGIYPADDVSLEAYCRAFVEALAELDILVVWGNPGEGRLEPLAAPSRRLVRIEAQEPWYYDPPWSSALEGRRVVVVHPFARTIEAQYARRERIWADPRILPQFDLRTVRMPLSPTLVAPDFPSWREQLASVSAEMLSSPFDVALIGAGGYSLPLVAAAKRAGASAFHMGGLTQVLFGVMGRRWERSQAITGSQNAYWARPSAEETPAAAVKVEQACYW